jgi:hypothetical protein
VVSITQDMMGGEWEQIVRDLRVRALPWLQPRDMTYRLGRLERPAKSADALETRSNLLQLDRAVRELEKAARQYAHNLTEFQRHVADLIGAVHQARTLAEQRPDPISPHEEYELETERLLAASDIGLDRVAKLYGLDRPGWR